MELFIIAWLAIAGIAGVAATRDPGKSSAVVVNKETRLIQQTRQTVYDQQVIKEWSAP